MLEFFIWHDDWDMIKNFWSGTVVWGAVVAVVWGVVMSVFSPSTSWLVVGWAEFASGTQLVQRITDLYELLDSTYYHRDELDIEVMQHKALKWFVDAIWDPYTVYLTPEENTIFDEWMQWSQNFEWIGAIVTDAEEGVLIEWVLKWSPAFEAGLEPLDIILQIEWELTKPLGLNEAVQKIRGPKDSIVILTILRNWAEEPIFDVPVTRGSISVPSAEAELIERDGSKILFLTISIFGDDTMRVIRNEVRQLWITASSELDGVVLDLRWNGWGYLPISVEVAWLFLPKNEIVTTARYSIFEDEVFKSPWYKILPDVPVTVLIDGMSASASEIVALALQERGNAHVIGVQSFGKWSIQSVQPGSDWSSLKLTVWRRYSPSNATIDEVGITPDQEVVFDIEAYLDDESDNQLEEAIEFLLWNNQ